MLLSAFGLLAYWGNHLRVLCTLLLLSTGGMGTLAFLGAAGGSLNLPTTTWLFLQSLCRDIAYLSFQTIFFERFIACFKVKGNVGFFIITIDFVGYMGTLLLLFFKELHAAHVDWAAFYDRMSLFFGAACCLCFLGSLLYLWRARRRAPLPRPQAEKAEEEDNIYAIHTAI